MKLSEKQTNLVRQAGKLLKEAFPEENMQFCFNLRTKHDNVNFNMDGKWKQSGILKPLGNTSKTYQPTHYRSKRK